MSVYRVVVLVFFGLQLFADGLPFDGENFTGPKVVLELSEEQKKVKLSNTIVALTADQVGAIKDVTGVQVQTITLFLLEDVLGSCTCEAVNIGIIYGNYVVIPLQFVGKDLDGRLINVQFDDKYIAPDPRVYRNPYTLVYVILCSLLAALLCIPILVKVLRTLRR